MTFVILSYIAMFSSSIYFMKSGADVINDPYYTTDKSINGTLLGIKWYHFFWLFIPISIYTQVILNLIYRIGLTIVTLIQNFELTTIFGGSDGKKGNAIDVAWGGLFVIVLIATLVIYLMDFLRKVLIGEADLNWAVKTLIAIGIGLVIPFLIIWFTNLV
jgi:hypothetical protein